MSDKRILYVEDNEDNVYMLKRRLERKGYTVEVAVTGEEGVDMVLASPPDLVLMDLSLPGIDGWEAITRIRAELGKELPIIALSAHAMEQHIKQALDAGADDFDSKPVELKRLLGKISQQLGE